MKRLAPFLITTAILSTLLGGCSSSPESSKAPSETLMVGHTNKPVDSLPSDSAQRHQAESDAWLHKASVSASKLGSMELSMLLNFSTEHGRVGVPTMNGYAVLHSPTKEVKFEIIPLLSEDAPINPRFAEVVNHQGVVARFDADILAVLVANSSDFGDIWGGLVLLHELRHAEQSTRPGWEAKSTRNAALRELEAYEMVDAALQSKPEYKAEVSKIEAIFLKSLQSGSALPEPEATMAAISTMGADFGPPQSNEEAKARRSQVLMTGALAAYATHSPADKREAAQVDFINSAMGRATY